MDRKLLDILACPATRQPLAMLEARGLDALNQAIRAGGVQRGDDSLQSEPLREALITRDRKRVYRQGDELYDLIGELAARLGTNRTTLVQVAVESLWGRLDGDGGADLVPALADRAARIDARRRAAGTEAARRSRARGKVYR